MTAIKHITGSQAAEMFQQTQWGNAEFAKIVYNNAVDDMGQYTKQKEREAFVAAKILHWTMKLNDDYKDIEYQYPTFEDYEKETNDQYQPK